MLGFAVRLVGGAIAPLTDRIAEFSASLLRKLALFLVAAVCLVVVVVALTIAFALWISSLAGSIVGALAVAGVYLFIAVAALYLALRKSSAKAQDDAKAHQAARERQPRSAVIDQFTAPILAALQALGLRKEQFAVYAGASVAKQLGPIPLVGAALLAGFLIGRLYKGWKSLLSVEAVAALVSAVSSVFGTAAAPQPDEDQLA